MTVALNTLASRIVTSSPITSTSSKTIFRKLVDFAVVHFNFMQWSFLSFYGAKELLFDRVKEIRETKNSPSSLMNHYLNGVFVRKDKMFGVVLFNVAHGSLYCASGVVGSLAAADRLGWVRMGSFTVPLEIAGNCLFGFASLVALIQNIKIYREASKISEKNPYHEQEAAQRLKKSAIMGIISTLNYIVAAALLIIGTHASLALILGCIAVFTGCIKIIYDFFRFRKAY